MSLRPSPRSLHAWLAAGSVAIVASTAACQKAAPPLASGGPPIFEVGKPAVTRGLLSSSSGTCAKRKDGFWCWGSIGDGQTYGTPTRLPLDDVVTLALGGSHYCVLKTDRTVACAGRDLDGELGDGQFTNRNELAPVRGLSNVVQLAAGAYKTCAIVEVPATSKYQVQCFGTDEGRGKNGMPARGSAPARIGDIDDARELTVSWGLGCARRADGSVWCWGSNEYGQLGNGAWTRWGKRPPPTSAPVRVLDVADAVGVSAGGFDACVLTARGTAGCWGENSYGALGDGTTQTRGSPSNVTGLADAAQVSSGGFGHACALRRDGTVWCWGYRVGAVRGKSWTRSEARTAPVRVAGIDDATEIATGHTHVCARRKNGSIVCWGDNSEGQVGDGTTANTESPREVLGPE